MAKDIVNIKNSNGNINMRISPKKCSIQGCQRKYFGRGYCQNHYRKYVWGAIEYSKRRRKGLDYTAGVCKRDNCNLGVYAKEYCYKHYQMYVYRKNEDHRQPCSFPGCKKTTTREYCFLHKERAKCYFMGGGA